MKQATMWQAQLVDGTFMRGGQQNAFPNQPVVESVPSPAVKIFSVVHNTFSDTYYEPWDTWYLNRIATEPIYPLVYKMQDKSILTINQDPETKDLIMTQDYGR